LLFLKSIKYRKQNLNNRRSEIKNGHLYKEAILIKIN